ncbi:MAG: hypothetical protein AAGI38_11760 [Bacteroidota bacterium]
MKTILFFLFALPGIIYSQLTWDRTYSAQGSIAYAIMPNSTGYAVAGDHEASGQLLLFQLDRYGNQLWVGSYGRRYGLFDREFMQDAAQAQDGSFFLAGLSYSIPDTNWGGHFAYIVKTDSMGRQLWDYQRYTSKEDIPFFSDFTDVEPTPDGGCIGVGYVYADKQNVPVGAVATNGLIVKLDSSGRVEFEKQYEIAPIDFSVDYSICKINGYSNGYFIINTADNFDKFSLLKISSSGDSLWSKVYRDPNASASNFYLGDCQIKPTSDNNYLLTTGGSESGIIMKLDSLGNTIWARYDIMYGAWNSFEDQDGNYVLSHGIFTVLSPCTPLSHTISLMKPISSVSDKQFPFPTASTSS